jgi:hypothetical protein
VQVAQIVDVVRGAGREECRACAAPVPSRLG